MNILVPLFCFFIGIPVSASVMKIPKFKIIASASALRLPADDGIMQCFVSGKYSVMTTDDQIYQTESIEDGKSSYPQITSKEECMRKAVDVAQDYASVTQANGTRIFGLQKVDASLFIWFSWGFGQFKKGWLTSSFQGVEGQITKATKAAISGYKEGDQRYYDSGGKWFQP